MAVSTRKHSKMREYVGIGLSSCLTVLAVASMGLALACHGGKVVGIENAEVLSGSMEPEIATGSLAYFTTDVDCPELKPGQVIAFQASKDTQVIHRVVKNDRQKKQLVTKGDANKIRDPLPVPYENVNGLVVGSVPYLGRLVNGIHDALTSVIPPDVGSQE
ncbi:MAG: signal peptidase I [Coriobacteriia bacterium]|nr:signal peptidase I [Coriobacteriia bacterium]